MYSLHNFRFTIIRFWSQDSICVGAVHFFFFFFFFFFFLIFLFFIENESA